jgi:hypothetical protein
VHTPNIDRFIKRSTLFSNFYVTPQCAQSRAQLLTGRNFVRTGTLSVSGGGWDVQPLLFKVMIRVKLQCHSCCTSVMDPFAAARDAGSC